MAVDWVKETSLLERSGSESGSGASYTRGYIARVTDKADDAVTVLASGSLPAMNAAHPNDSAAKVTSRQASPRDGDLYVWDVTIEYSTESGDGTDNESNPLDRATEWNSGLTSRLVVANQGKLVTGGVPGATEKILNTAGDPFQPRPEVDDVSHVLTADRFEAVLPALATWNNAVNDSAIWGYPKHSLRCTTTFRHHWERGSLYYAVHYEFEYNRDLWYLHILNAGFRIKTSDNPAKYALAKSDQADENWSEPVPLNADGDGIVQPNGTVVVRQYIPSQWSIQDYSALALTPP